MVRSRAGFLLGLHEQSCADVCVDGDGWVLETDVIDGDHVGLAQEHAGETGFLIVNVGHLQQLSGYCPFRRGMRLNLKRSRRILKERGFSQPT
jgi:hypothetical protein